MTAPAPCTNCGDPGGLRVRGRQSPIRIRGVCGACDRKVRRLMAAEGLDYDEALAGLAAPAAPVLLPGCRPYRHPEEPMPVPEVGDERFSGSMGGRLDAAVLRAGRDHDLSR